MLLCVWGHVRVALCEWFGVSLCMMWCVGCGMCGGMICGFYMVCVGCAFGHVWYGV